MHLSLNGDAVYLATGGEAIDPAKPAVCFIHGAGLDHTAWVLLNRYFARNGFNSLAPDLPGHGKSAGEPMQTIAAMADWTLSLLQELGIDRTSLVGHSMGSLVALETTARANNVINRCAMLGTAVPMTVGEPLLQAAREKSQAAIDMIMLFGHAYSSQLGGNPVAGINILNANMRILERGLCTTLYTDLHACNEYRTGLDAAARITRPVHLILGEEDRMTPPAGSVELVSCLRECSVSRLPGTGHLMVTEQPELVHRELVRFLQPV